MRIAVCEDSPADMESLKTSITEVLTNMGLLLEVDYYCSGEALITAMENGKSYLLAILDIYMKSLDGIAAARKIRSILPDIQLAFLTTSREFMLDAFELDAIHYMLKPVETQKLKDCFERFRARMQMPPQMLEIKSEVKSYTFLLEHVQKILSCNKGIDVYINGERLPCHIPISMAKALEQLDPAIFLKISRGVIVKMSYILCIDKDICRLQDGTEILLSRRDKSDIRKKYNDYLFRK